MKKSASWELNISAQNITQNNIYMLNKYLFIKKSMNWFGNWVVDLWNTFPGGSRRGVTRLFQA